MTEAWSFFLFHTPLNTSAGTGQITEMTEATDRSLSFSLTDGATLSFSLPGSHQDTPEYLPGLTDVIAYRGERAMQRFLITERSVSWEGGVSTCSYQAKSYRSLLDRWLIAEGDTRDFTAVEQTAIAWTLIAAAEARSGEQWKLTRGLMPDTGVNRTRVGAADATEGEHGYDTGAKIGEMVQALADVDNGFDWDIEPDASSPDTDLEFNVWNERKQHDGPISDFVLDAGGTVAAFGWQESMSEYANVVRATGKAPTGDNSGVTATGPVTVLDQAASTDYGRWEQALSFDDVTQAALDQAAGAAIERWMDPGPDWKVVLRPDRWSPEAAWLGDSLLFVGTIAPLGDLEEIRRVHQVDVALTDEGAETITLTLGRPPKDFLGELGRRVSALERR